MFDDAAHSVHFVRYCELWEGYHVGEVHGGVRLHTQAQVDGMDTKRPDQQYLLFRQAYYLVCFTLLVGRRLRAMCGIS